MNVHSTTELHAGLLRQIAEISSLQDQVQLAVQTMSKRHGDPSEAVACAKALETAVTDLKRDLVRHYFEYRIVAAAQAMDAVNN
ncbi:MAG TPA: hypothetical protein VJN43_15555 [Bryobacteraceae bacterium]|nr:hypothetical protein [Bryobacteraceae bacterium]